jgi:hypothetical protein
LPVLFFVWLRIGGCGQFDNLLHNRFVQ